MKKLTTTKLRNLIERPQEAILWGQKYTITPRLVSEVFGDGKRLICFSSTNHRPNYYVVLGCSTWAMDNSDDDDPNAIDTADWTEWVQESIEGEFGVCEEDDDYFPMASFDSGIAWEEMDAVELVKS